MEKRGSPVTQLSKAVYLKLSVVNFAKESNSTVAACYVSIMKVNVQGWREAKQH